MTKDKAIKQASILVTVLLTDEIISEKEAEILRQAIQEPEQEPAAYLYKYRDGWTTQLRFDGSNPLETKKLYTEPPVREWVGLTDEEIDALAMDENGLPNSHVELARAIEAKLKEKNS